MGTAIVIIVIVLIGVPLFVQSVSKSTGRAKARRANHDRCAYCRSRLKKNAGRDGFAEVCRKCGRTQPWATQA